MKKKIIIAAITIIVIILATWGRSHWFSRTRIAFVNYQAIELAQISRANDNGMIKIENLSVENLDELNKYDMVFVQAMGLKLTGAHHDGCPKGGSHTKYDDYNSRKRFYDHWQG